MKRNKIKNIIVAIILLSASTLNSRADECRLSLQSVEVVGSDLMVNNPQELTYYNIYNNTRLPFENEGGKPILFAPPPGIGDDDTAQKMLSPVPEGMWVLLGLGLLYIFSRSLMCIFRKKIAQ